MVDVASLIAICNSVLSSGSKVVEKYKRKRLTDFEKELLVAAAKKGQFHLLSVEQIPGTWVRVESKDFIEDSDPAFAAIYLEAFRSLCERGLIIHVCGNRFSLRGSGFKKARVLAAKTK